MDNQNEFNNPMNEFKNDFNSPIQDTPKYENGNQQNNFILHSIIDSLSGWMKFIGIYTIVIGAITCIGIVTAAIGIPMIFSGIALTKSSKSIITYKHYNSPYTLYEIFTSLNKYFKIQGIFIIIGIILSIIYIVALIFILIMSVNGFFQFNLY